LPAEAALGVAALVAAFAAAVLGAASALAAGILPCPGMRALPALGSVWARRALVRVALVQGAVMLVATLVAVGALEWGLLRPDFRLAYVVAHDSVQTPLLFRVTALWSALQGSMLLWATLLAAWVAGLAAWARARRDDPRVPWALVAAFGVCAWFLAMLLGPARPFALVHGTPPANGAGPNPLLEDDVLVAVHPPLLYLGLTGLTVPFALMVGALATGCSDPRWQRQTRTWLFAAWVPLGIGILLGAWWSYRVLGWGGFFAWDPVENASIMPWLAGAAFLHASLVEERRGSFMALDAALALGAFELSLLATFLTRSGVVVSVHAFSVSPVGAPLLGLLGATLLVALGLLAWRADAWRGPPAVLSPTGREAALALKSALVGGLLVVVLVGTLVPVVASAFGRTLTVGPPYYGSTALPFGVGLLVLMGVGPLAEWSRTPGARLPGRLLLPALCGLAALVVAHAAGVRAIGPLMVAGAASFALVGNGGVAIWRARRSLRSLLKSLLKAHGRSQSAARRSWWRLPGSVGGVMAHAGAALVALALALGGALAVHREVTLASGRPAEIAGHSVELVGVRQVARPGARATEVLVSVDRGHLLRPSVTWFGSATEGVGKPAIEVGLGADIYLWLASLPTGPRAPVRLVVLVQPLYGWVFAGGGLLALGTVLALAGRVRRATRRLRGATRPAGVGEIESAAAMSPAEAVLAAAAGARGEAEASQP
jgi:cytochrome c-type biogenesis protein CcmF